MSPKNKASPLIIDSWQKLVILFNKTKKWPIHNISIKLDNFEWTNHTLHKLIIRKDGLAFLTLSKNILEEYLLITKESFKPPTKPRRIIKKRKLKMHKLFKGRN